MKSSTYYYGKIHCLSTGTIFSGRAWSSGGLRKCFRGFCCSSEGRRRRVMGVGKGRGETASQNQGSYAPFVGWECFQLRQHEPHNITLSRSKQISAFHRNRIASPSGANHYATVLFSSSSEHLNADIIGTSIKAWGSIMISYLDDVFKNWPVHDYNPYSFSLH